MLWLKLPTVEDDVFYNFFLGGIQAIDDEVLLNELNSLVINARCNYVDVAKKREFYYINPTNYLGKDKLKKALLWLYDTRFRSFSCKKKNVASLYELVKERVTNCGYCVKGNVSELDHYLPQAVYPEFAVVIENLVPVCRECNMIKHDYYPTTMVEMLLHPYYDNFTDKVWLGARVIDGDCPIVEYFVEEGSDQDRLYNHLSTLKLFERYSNRAAVLLSELKIQFVRDYTSDKENGIRHCLTEYIEYGEKIYGANGFMVVMYRALLESRWFLEEGFKKIPEKEALNTGVKQ